jgi:hypothetical protein
MPNLGAILVTTASGRSSSRLLRRIAPRKASRIAVDVAGALAIPVYLTRYAGTHIWSEPWAWSRTALDLPGAATHPLRPAALLAASDGAWQHGEHTRAVEFAETVIGLVEPGSEMWRESHRVLAGALVWLRRFEEADAAATTAVTGQPSDVTDATLTRISTLALIRNPRRDEALPPGRQPHPSARLRLWLIRPLVRLCAHDAAAVVDGATRDQPELGQLASSRATNIAQARKALGPAFDTAAEHGATMTDDELVAYLDEVTPRSPPAQPVRAERKAGTRPKEDVRSGPSTAR